MLQVLYDAEAALPALLADRVTWKSVNVNYHPPVVERLWREWGQYRIYLHRIHPCELSEALMHPHPWPSTMRVHGRYEMGVGYGTSESAPPLAAKLVLAPGTAYEMVEQDGWHYVRPLGVPSLSVMVAGKPWERWSPKSYKPLGPLNDEARDRLFAQFCELYP